MSAQVAADLRAAADVLERDGWTQGQYFLGRSCCQAGALLRALEPGAQRTGEMSDSAYARWLTAEAALDSFLSKDGLAGRAIEWNDEVATSAAEVIAALRAAADRAEAEL